MKVKISQQQMDKLLEAARLARDPGNCRYVKDGQPCCVIAQLAVLHGTPTERFAKYDQGLDGKGSDSLENRRLRLATDFGLRGWNRTALSRVQAAWDSYDDEPEARHHLFEEIYQVFEVAPEQ